MSWIWIHSCWRATWDVRFRTWVDQSDDLGYFCWRGLSDRSAEKPSWLREGRSSSEQQPGWSSWEETPLLWEGPWWPSRGLPLGGVTAEAPNPQGVASPMFMATRSCLLWVASSETFRWEAEASPLLSPMVQLWRAVMEGTSFPYSLRTCFAFSLNSGRKFVLLTSAVSIALICCVSSFFFFLIPFQLALLVWLVLWTKITYSPIHLWVGAWALEWHRYEVQSSLGCCISQDGLGSAIVIIPNLSGLNPKGFISLLCVMSIVGWLGAVLQITFRDLDGRHSHHLVHHWYDNKRKGTWQITHFL